MDLLRIYLFSAMVAHKLVWEVLRRRDGNAGRVPFTPIKAVKIAVLGGLLLQCFLPEILPIANEPRVLRVAGAALLTLGLAVAVAARVQLGGTGPTWSRPPYCLASNWSRPGCTATSATPFTSATSCWWRATSWR